MKNIKDELKIYELSLIWKEAEYNFAFWDSLNNSLDWDKEYKTALERVLKTNDLYEYYLELMRFVSLLNDGHTGVWFPKEIENSSEYTSKLPVNFKYVDNKVVIQNIKESVKHEVKRWSVVKSINNVEIIKYLEQNVYPYIWHEKIDSAFYSINTFLRNGPLYSTIDLVLETDGEEYKVSLTRTKGDMDWVYEAEELTFEEVKEVYSSESHKISLTKDNIAVIQIDTFMNDDLPKNIFSNYELLKKASGYIIDVRNNGGGNSGNADHVASLFIGNEFNNGFALHPIHIGAYKAWSKYNKFKDMTYKEVIAKHGESDFIEKLYKIPRHIYYDGGLSNAKIDKLPGVLKGPIIILSSKHTGSSAENFLIVMKKYTNALIIGSSSGGSTGQPLTIELESGGGFRICTRHSLTLDKEEFINIGIKPNIECKMSIDDYKNNTDSVMNKALDEIRKIMNE